MAEPRSTPGKAGEFLGEAAGLWRAMPDKPLFFSLSIVWVIFFHVLGNSTFGYTDTPSLFAWLNYAYHNSVDDQHGFLVPVEDDAAAAERLLPLLRDPERRAKIGESGRKFVQTRFSADVMIQKLIAVYRDLLAERNNKR